MADASPDNYHACMTNSGPQYLQAVSNLFQETDAKTFLANVATSQSARQAERRLAAILLTRMERPSVFDEVSKFVVETRKRPDAEGRRGGYFAGCVWEFTARGLESKYVWETGPRRLTKNGWENEERKVEKYTDEEVGTGKARNAAARLAVVEYFLKFSGNFNDYETSEMLSVLKRLEYGQYGRAGGKRPAGSIRTEDLIEDVLKDETADIPVRVAAVSLLPEDKLDKVPVAGLMVKALQDEALQDDRKYRRTADTAAEFLRLYGDRQNLSALKTNEPYAQWKRELVEKTMKEMSARTGDSPQGSAP
jgi:hypothetical protein